MYVHMCMLFLLRAAQSKSIFGSCDSALGIMAVRRQTSIVEEFVGTDLHVTKPMRFKVTVT